MLRNWDYSVIQEFTVHPSARFIFRMEHQANLLWINSDSAYNIHEKWLQNNFKKNERAQILVVKNDNVLTPESINLVSNDFF